MLMMHLEALRVQPISFLPQTSLLVGVFNLKSTLRSAYGSIFHNEQLTYSLEPWTVSFIKNHCEVHGESLRLLSLGTLSTLPDNHAKLRQSLLS